jgi:hypothetical protein
MIANTQSVETERISKFILNNIPLILQIRAYAHTKYGDEPEFFVPPFENINDFLQTVEWPMFDYRKTNITINPYRNDVQYISKNVYANVQDFSSEPDVYNYSVENIDLLRSLFRKKMGSRKDKTPTVCIVVNKDALGLISPELGSQIQKVHFVKKAGTEEETKWNVVFLEEQSDMKNIVNTLPTIDWLILEEDSQIGDYLYLMNKTSKVFEIRREQHIEGVSSVKTVQGLEKLCGACGLTYIMGIAKYREPLIDQRQNILLDVGRAIRKYGLNEIVHMLESKAKPKIIKPARKALSGYHIHSGDSFREMLDIWKESGYIEVEESDETPYVWYNKIGDVLLYDRDTNMWFNNDKEHGILNYRVGLFGNSGLPGPSVMDYSRQSIWSYWPRYPKQVKKIYDKNNQIKGFDERLIESLFLGKIENNVQMKNRTKHDWSSVIELFECPVDSSGKSYKYGPSEYLEKLCDSKYGLSLAGFGPKCHREIEYFACGVVPLVAPECDMDGFLNPPKEGIHYFRVNEPSDVVKIMKETTKEQWETMSKEGKKWYTNNCSPEGLFKLTFERIKQIDPYVGIGLPKWNTNY